MNDELRLRLSIADLILAVVDEQELMDRSDLQSFADITAQRVIAMVRGSES